MLKAALIETVKVITKINDIVVSLKEVSVSTGTYINGGPKSKYNFYVNLRESKSFVALYLLNNSTDGELFSLTLSKKLNAPLSMSILYWAFIEVTLPPSSSPSSPPVSSSPVSSKASSPSSKRRKKSESKIISLHCLQHTYIHHSHHEYSAVLYSSLHYLII